MTDIYNQINDKITSKKINDYAFINDESITELIIPEGVTHIGERAFYGCKNLKKIVLPQSLISIGASAFSGCENLEEIVIPQGTKKISYRAFADCKRLKKITIHEGLEELEWAVFSGCENLEEVVLPESLKELGKQTFLNCKKLKKVILPTYLEELPDECFKGCSQLDITLHKNIKKIGTRTFERCYNLSTFPQNVIFFGEDCFKNCRNLTTAIINNQTKELPSGMFDGCIKLKEIIYENDKKLKIGKRCFRNCKTITAIPDFVANFNDRAFENCIGITYIDIIDSNIPFACFRGCTSLKQINNQESIIRISSFAFSGCENLEEIDIVHSNIIPSEAFSNCKNLKKIRLNLTINKINSRAFYNCHNLSIINFPESLTIIKKEAFKNCHKIKKITIPANLTSFGDGAFSYMNSLETIDVSLYNKTFITPDHKILINQMQQKLVLYASGCKDKSYSLKDYVIEKDIFEHEIIKPITCIGEYAFAGAQNLEELTVCACTQDIEATAFYGCENLKNLNIEAIPLYTCPGFNIRDHGRYYFEEKAKQQVYMPFENVTFNGNIVQIFPNALSKFTNVKTLNLQGKSAYNISAGAFVDCTLLKEVNIPNQVKNIAQNSFPTSTKLIFENGLQAQGLIELAHNDEYIGEYKLYTLEDGTYYIEQGDKITTITKEQINKICSHPEAINDNPILYLDFMNDLFKHDLAIKQLFNGILMANLSLENRKILFNNLNKEDKFFLEVLKHSELLDKCDDDTEQLLKTADFEKVISYINLLKKYNIDNPLLYNKFFMTNYPLDNFEKLINFDLSLFVKTIENSKLFQPDNITLILEDSKENRDSYYLAYQILTKNSIANFMKYVKEYDIKDKYLFEKPFIAICNNPTSEKLFKVYDANTKRLLKASMTTQKNISAIQNLNDLLILMDIIGALEEDEITRQRASTFITEKIFDDKMPNGSTNEFRIIGDDIHRIFNFPYTRDEFDKEFADFFIENYQELIKEEKKHSGFIQRVYLNFRQISRTCTSHKGSQRKLKVTIEKCKNYLSNVKFDGVTDDTKDLAKLIGSWYDNNLTWINAQKVYHESLNAPRNIFTKVTQTEDGSIIYDNNPENDLKENINPNFSYEWLPKQDYDNLVLGKYCNCCAHIEGAGQGIMRASMILDNCQNLVIRDNLGAIIAKSTIYVNKEEGYAVFNNVESSLNNRTYEDKQKIYNAFLRGATAFLKTYNENNEHFITNITIGANRNTIIEYLSNDKHPFVDIQQALQYGEYSLKSYGYNGDWSSKQKLVLKI